MQCVISILWWHYMIYQYGKEFFLETEGAEGLSYLFILLIYQIKIKTFPTKT